MLRDIPLKQYVSDREKREEIKDYVLSLCMDSSVNGNIPTSFEAKDTLYAGFSPQSTVPICALTGFPIDNTYEVKHIDDVCVNKSDWELIISKTNSCPLSRKA